MTENSFLV